MKRLLAGSVVAASLLVTGSSHAHWESGATLVSMSLGYLAAEDRLTADTISGAAVDGALEFVVPRRPLSFGLSFSSLIFDENGRLPPEEGGGRGEIRLSSKPVLAMLKGWIGGDRVRGYGGLGLGFHNSKLEVSADEVYRIWTSTGFAMKVPVGAVLFLGSKVFLDGGVALYVLGDSFYASNVAGTAYLGAGIKFADW